MDIFCDFLQVTVILNLSRIFVNSKRKSLLHYLVDYLSVVVLMSSYVPLTVFWRPVSPAARGVVMVTMPRDSLFLCRKREQLSETVSSDPQSVT
jgi:hypothetical protein